MPFRKRLAKIGAVLAPACLLTLAIILCKSARATPQFARETRFACAKCHLHVPLLNEFGQRFYANGFKVPGQKKVNSAPAFVELTTDFDFGGGSQAVPVVFDGLTIGSADWVSGLGLLYKAHYQPVAHSQDLTVIRPIVSQASLEVGRFHPISQLDPDLQLGLSLPQFLSPADPNFGVDASHNQAGPFAPANIVDGLRLRLGERGGLPFSQGWQGTLSVPFTTDLGGNSPQGQAGLSTLPQGLFAELFNRTGLDTYGLNAYVGRDNRSYVGALVQRKIGRIYATAGAASAKTAGLTTNIASVGGSWIPCFNGALGARVDLQGSQASFTSFVSLLTGGKQRVYNVIVEMTAQRGVPPTGTVELSLKF